VNQKTERFAKTKQNAESPHCVDVAVAQVPFTIPGRKWSCSLHPKEEYWEMHNEEFHRCLKRKNSLRFSQCW